MREVDLRRLLLLVPLRERAQPLVAHGGPVELHPLDLDARAAEAVEDCFETPRAQVVIVMHVEALDDEPAVRQSTREQVANRLT